MEDNLIFVSREKLKGTWDIGEKLGRLTFGAVAEVSDSVIIYFAFAVLALREETLTNFVSVERFDLFKKSWVLKPKPIK